MRRIDGRTRRAGLRSTSQCGSIASGPFTARGTVGWRHAVGNVRPSSAFTFANGGTSFPVSGVPIARDGAVPEAGIDANLAKRLTRGLTYSGAGRQRRARRRDPRQHPVEILTGS